MDNRCAKKIQDGMDAIKADMFIRYPEITETFDYRMHIYDDKIAIDFYIRGTKAGNPLVIPNDESVIEAYVAAFKVWLYDQLDAMLIAEGLPSNDNTIQ